MLLIVNFPQDAAPTSGCIGAQRPGIVTSDSSYTDLNRAVYPGFSLSFDDERKVELGILRWR